MKRRGEPTSPTDQAEGGQPVDVLVGTHEHWDHISGFVQAKDVFDKFEVGEVWLAWTEDPRDATANRLRKRERIRLAALWLGVGGLRPRPGGGEGTKRPNRSSERPRYSASSGSIPTSSRRRAATWAAEAATRGKTAEAMDWLRTKTENPKFWKPGDTDVLPGTGVRSTCSGRRPILVSCSRTSRPAPGRRHTRRWPTWPPPRGAFAVNSPASDDLPGTDTMIPFDPKYQITEDVARDVEFFRDHYFGPGGA